MVDFVKFFQFDFARGDPCAGSTFRALWYNRARMPACPTFTPSAACLTLVRCLADGAWHDETDLRASSGTRLALCEALGDAADLGLHIRSDGEGRYRLDSPLELLDAADVVAPLDQRSRALLGHFELLESVDSTSQRLLDAARAGWPSGSVCLAEHQTAGRGRLGRPWVSPYARNLYLSVLWRFRGKARRLSGLSCAMGVAVAQTLRSEGADEVRLKWPNDLVWGERKLGGVLVDVVAGGSDAVLAVIGVGINVAMPQEAAAAIDQAWTDLRSVCSRAPSRNRLAGVLMHHLLLSLAEFEEAGLGPFLDRWDALDAVRGRPVTLRWADQLVSGVALGIDGEGALRLARQGRTECYRAGEVSLRLGP